MTKRVALASRRAELNHLRFREPVHDDFAASGSNGSGSRVVGDELTTFCACTDSRTLYYRVIFCGARR
jgi:hypothetical protein